MATQRCCDRLSFSLDETQPAPAVHALRSLVFRIVGAPLASTDICAAERADGRSGAPRPIHVRSQAVTVGRGNKTAHQTHAT